jgi:hypothetical protein
MKTIALFFIFTLFIFTSCDKVKRSSKFLMKGETWNVQSVKIDGTEIATKGSWTISQGVDIYKGVPEAMWKTDNTNSAVFEWQFHEKANKFQLNYKQICEECDGEMLDEMDYLTYDLTGSYSVEKHKRKKMIFKCSSTIGYDDKEVVIAIERQ